MPIPDPAADTGLPDEEAKRASQYAKFNRLYFDWLAARAAELDPSVGDSDAACDFASERTAEAARRLMITPASLPWMIWQKWEVLEFYLSADGDPGSWTDNRHVTFLTCVKSDLMRFKIKEPGE